MADAKKETPTTPSPSAAITPDAPKAVKEAVNDARAKAAERDQLEQDAQEQALQAREQAYQDVLKEAKPAGVEAITPAVRAPRTEEALDATTQGTIELLKQRDLQRQIELERIRSSADALNAQNQRPVVVTDAVLRAGQAASAAAEAALLRLDEVPLTGAVYTINGVPVDPNGSPLQNR